jgi:hypothetical protein
MLSLGSEPFVAGRSLGLMLIRFSSVAPTIITMIPPTLNAICIAIPFEMSSSATWLTNASKTPRQWIGSEFWPQQIAPRITGVFSVRLLVAD